MVSMTLVSRQLLLVLLLLGVFNGYCKAEFGKETSQKFRTAPLKDAASGVIDGSGTEHIFNADTTNNGAGERKGGNSRVPVSTVAFLTMAMAAATGLGAIPFFFVELDSQWSGVCNGMASGVMLAASFDLIQEGQDHGSGSWVVFGILTGGVFIWLCKQVIALALLTFFLLIVFWVVNFSSV